MLYFCLLEGYSEVVFPFHRIAPSTKFLDFVTLSEINALGQ